MTFARTLLATQTRDQKQKQKRDRMFWLLGIVLLGIVVLGYIPLSMEAANALRLLILLVSLVTLWTSTMW
jgi:hypothetical protein